MPNEIDLGKPPAGYCVTSPPSNEEVVIQFLEFTSTEDGQHFIQRLEGIPSDILQKASPQISPSQVDNMLAIVRRDGKATVYVNELAQRAHVRVSGPIKAGAVVTKDDVVDVDRLELDVQIPNDAGVVFIFSVGWRKALFYDFGPLRGPDPQLRQYDVADLLGQAYCHVLFQNRFSISDAEWDALFAAKWFPFAGLRNDSIDALISYIRSGREPDDKLDDFVAEAKGRVTQMLDSWGNRSSFAPHMSILERAVERFLDNDFVSCTGLLFPRIEGILRTHHTNLGTVNRSSPGNLTDSAVAAKIENDKCLLMPRRFAAYLRDIYFANFDPSAQDIDVSRHSVGHGVAAASEFNQKSALIAILVVHQLFYFLEGQRNDQAEDGKEVNVTQGA